MASPIPDIQPITKILYDRKSAASTLSISLRALDYATSYGMIEYVQQGSKKMYLHSHLLKFASTPHRSFVQRVDKGGMANALACAFSTIEPRNKPCIESQTQCRQMEV
jgi:hypothetical protein